MAQKKQRTEKTPQGYEVPVPKRKDFFGNLKKVAKSSPARSRPKK